MTPGALTIALLIHAESMQQRHGGFEYATHHVLSHAVDLMGWSEERKADLYARIVEKMSNRDHTRFLVVQEVVAQCLKENAKWPN